MARIVFILGAGASKAAGVIIIEVNDYESIIELDMTCGDVLPSVYSRQTQERRDWNRVLG